jgi:hypothetical protein
MKIPPEHNNEKARRAVNTASPVSLADIGQHFCYISTAGEWWDTSALDDGRLVHFSPTLFNAYVQNKTGLPNGHAELIGRQETACAECVGYEPGSDRLYHRNGGVRLNLWTAGGVVAAKGDWSLISRVLDHLMPTDDRAKLLNAMASMLRHPEIKVSWGIILRGLVGTGKGLIFGGVASRLVGHANHTDLQGDAIASRFNAELGDCVFLYIDEISIPNDLPTANRIKKLATDRYFKREGKGQSRREMFCPTFMALTSNTHRVIRLENPERRWLIPPYVRTHLDGDLGLALKNDLDSQSAAFKWYLLNEHDMGEFDPGTPMWGGSFEDDEQVEGDGFDDLKNILAAVAEGMGDQALALLPDIVKAIQGQGGAGWAPDSVALKPALERAGWKPVCKLKRGRSGCPWVWARPPIEGDCVDWSNLSYTEVHAHLVAHGVI